MDEKNPVLSHQLDVVLRLSPFFSKITVITGQSSNPKVPNNIEIHNMVWVENRPVRNMILYWYHLCKIFSQTKPDVVFSHMTEVQSLLTLPFTITNRIPHYLWYAHKHKSIPLQISRPFVTAIITSTEGSCPFVGTGVIPIGQAIDFDSFHNLPKKKNKRLELVHIGRADPSKNLDLILEAFSIASKKYRDLKLTFIGSPSTAEYSLQLDQLKSKYRNEILTGKVKFTSSVERRLVSDVLQNFDIFIHAYNGSLDKSILESTASGIPVVTLNQEFRKEFGTWSNNLNATLSDELISCLDEHSDLVCKKVLNQQEILKNSHSLEIWIKRLVLILESRIK